MDLIQFNYNLEIFLNKIIENKDKKVIINLNKDHLLLVMHMINKYIKFHKYYKIKEHKKLIQLVIKITNIEEKVIIHLIKIII